MIKINLIARTSENPTNLISHAAKTCYTSTLPEMGNTMDVENNLFKTGHHTTFQHNFFTFSIEGLSVSSTIFGLHLTHPFYNTDQRSGRFSKMYAKPDFKEIENYIMSFWYDCNIEKVMNFVKKGREIFAENIEKATELVIEQIKKERPNANEDYIKLNAPKIAQEQLRMFISTISPTALDFSINLSGLAAIYRSAWSQEMRYMTEQMKILVLAEYPELLYVFKDNIRRTDDWSPKFDFKNFTIKKEPKLDVLDIDLSKDMVLQTNAKDSVDIRYFTPESMENNINTVKTKVEFSLATMAQDQRHRTIKRGSPLLTGGFYLPPIMQEMNLEKTTEDFLNMYRDIIETENKNLAVALAPYGVMASYTKLSDINALIHEQEKRLCWSTQEEIYNASKQLHDILMDSNNILAKDLARHLKPACYKDRCIEGRRYCGRDLTKVKNSEELPNRKI